MAEFLICEMKKANIPERDIWFRYPVGIMEGEEGEDANHIALSIAESLEAFGFQDASAHNRGGGMATIQYGRKKSYLTVKKIDNISGDYVAGHLRADDQLNCDPDK